MTKKDEGGINTAEFMVPASDARGQSARAPGFRCQIGHLHEMGKILQSGRFPYGTSSDLMRHAFKRHLEYLHALGGPISSVWGITEAIIELVREQQMQQRFADTLHLLEETVSTSLGLGERSEAKRLVRQVKYDVEKMPEGRWKEKWRADLKKKFAHLDDSGRTIKVGRGE